MGRYGRNRRVILFNIVLIGFFVVNLAFPSLSFAKDENVEITNVKYNIKCSVDDRKNVLSCLQETRFLIKGSLNRIVFHFYPHRIWSKQDILRYIEYIRMFSVGLDRIIVSEFFKNGSDINSIVIYDGDENKVPIDFDYILDGSLLELRRKDGKSFSGNIVVKFDYSVYVPERIGRFGREGGVLSLYRFYPILDVVKNGKFCLYPDEILHQPYISKASQYHVEILADKNIVVASSLNLVKKEISGGKVVWQGSSTIPIRDFYLAVSRKYKLIEGKYKDTIIKVYYLGERRSKAQRILEIVKDAMEFYSDKIGDYPYPVFSVIPISLGYGGNETSCAQMLDFRVYDIPFILHRYQEFLVAHELGHQWWFNMVGSDEYSQTWMDEGINSYFVYCYLRSKYGENPYVIDMPKYLKLFFPNFTFTGSSVYRWRYFVRRGISVPVIGPLKGFGSPSVVFAMAYGRGMSALVSLEKLYGKNRLFALFRKYFDKYKFRIAYVSDFKKILQDELGEPALEILNYYLSGKTADFYWRRRRNKLILMNRGDYKLGNVCVDIEEKKNTFKKEDYAKHIAGDKDTKSAQENDGYVCSGKMMMESEEITLTDKRYLWIDKDDIILEKDELNNIYPFYKSFDVDWVWLNMPWYDVPVVNEKNTLRFGGYLESDGVGARMSLIFPQMWSYVWASFVCGRDEEKFEINAKRRFLFSGKFDLSFRYVYEDADVSYKRFLVEIERPLDFMGVLGLSSKRKISLYIGRDIDLKDNQLRYSVRDFAYVGASVRWGFGVYEVGARLEKSGHFLGGRDDMVRMMIDGSYSMEFAQCKLHISGKLGLSEDADAWFYLSGVGAIESVRKRKLAFKDIGFMRADLMVPIYKGAISHNRNGFLSVDYVSLGPMCSFGAGWNGSISDRKQYYEVGLSFQFDVSVCSNVFVLPIKLDVSHCFGDEEDSRINVYLKL